MKRSQQQEVERIVNLWLDYVEVEEYNESQANMCERLQGKIHTYQGDLPQSGAYKPETVAALAERLRRPSKEEMWAKAILFELDYKLERALVTRWIELKKKVNPDTRQTFTQREIGLSFSMPLDTYLQEREKACIKLLELAERFPVRMINAA